MQVKEIMNTDVKTIGPDAMIQEAAQKMTEYHVGGLVVVTKSSLAGIVTERDIIAKVVAGAKRPEKTRVRDVMTQEIFYITPDTTVQDAADIMLDKKIKKLPVVAKGVLVGIVTATNICAAQPQLIEKMADYLFSPKQQSMAG